jgi:hypothetical protein
MARQGRKAFLKRRVASRVSRVSSKEAYIVSFWSAEVRFSCAFRTQDGHRVFGFGAYAAGAEIYKTSGTLSVISLGLFIAAGYALSIFVRRNEVTLRSRAEAALSDHSCG